MPSHRKHHHTPSISPQTSSTAIPHPNFYTKCHYTKLIYLCAHYNFTTKPFVINHVTPCPHHMTNRGRCNNMASVPYEKCIGELCSECRPVSLGVQPHLRSFEVLGGSGSREKKGAGIEGEGGDGEGEEEEEGDRDWGVEGEEIKKGLKALEETFRGLDIEDTIYAGNAARDKRNKGELVDVKTRHETLTTETTPPAVEKDEHHTPTIEATAPTAEKEEARKTAEPKASTQAPTTERTETEIKSLFLTSLLKIFKPDSSHVSPTKPTTPTKTTTTTTSSQAQTQTQTQNQSASTDPEVWISIPQDPDWETVTQEEKKEVDRKLWKDKGEWIKVNTNQET